MTDLSIPLSERVDIVFPVRGQSLPRDHAQALQLALCAQWPWLCSEDGAGVHPVKLVHGAQDPGLLSHRARLMLRVGALRAEELLTFVGGDLAVAGHALRLGSPHRRELLPHATLYAYKVAADGEDEVASMAVVERELAAMGVGGERICGKHQRMRVSGRDIGTFSLMLHGLSAAQSLRLQCQGLGPHRLLGCGVFVPHKSATAV